LANNRKNIQKIGVTSIVTPLAFLSYFVQCHGLNTAKYLSKSVNGRRERACVDCVER